MLQDIPRHGIPLGEELEHLGSQVNALARTELADLYPVDTDGAIPITYIWARTVSCEAPNCGAEIPLMRSFWLRKKGKANRALRFRIIRANERVPRIEFEIFEPKIGSEVPSATVTRAKARCLACGAILPPARVRAQLAAQHGGANAVFAPDGHRAAGARMIAVVLIRPGATGRDYRLPTDRDYAVIREAQARLAAVMEAWRSAQPEKPCPLPDEPTPVGGGSGAGRAFSLRSYGILTWSDLFTARQNVALLTIANLIATHALSTNAKNLLALCFSKMVDMNNAFSSWQPHAEIPAHMFTRFAIPMKWDYSEAVPVSSSSGTLDSAIKRAMDALPSIAVLESRGNVQLADATDHPLPSESASIWFTDPPYYDAVPYADLSDFFLAWLTRALPAESLLRDPFDRDNPLSEKRREAVQDETKRDDGRPKDRAWFEETMAKAFAEGRRVLREDCIGAVVFAHKTTEGWEALLSGMIRGGWTITGSWPIATEMGTRLRARDSAALATSVHLVCRPRSDDAKIGDWAEVLRELPRRVGDWMERLQTEGVRGADLVFACIGPSLEVFSRYASVETAEGRAVLLSEYLEKVWEVVGRSALEHVLGTAEARARNGAAGALEEDARLTALFLWTIQSTNGELEPSSNDDEDGDVDEEEDAGLSSDARKGFTLVFDVVRRFAQPLGIDLTKWQGRIIDVRKGVVRLLPITERSKQLFGADGAQAVATRLEEEALHDGNPLQGMLFPEMEVAPRTPRQRRGTLTNGQLSDESFATAREATTLDRVHAAMLLQAGGRTNALRALLKSEQERSPEFLRLANALTALYPKGSEEKRLLDAMLLSVPR